MRIVRLTFPLLVSALFLISAHAQSNDKKVFTADLNGNGKPDRIVEVKYKKPVKQFSRTDETRCETRVGHFAKYVLYLDNQKRGKVIFEYMYGSPEADYWQYGIDKAIDLNRDGVKDLIFYAGDDTSQEHVFLIQKTGYFKAVYAGVFESDLYPELNKTNDVIIQPDNSAPVIVAKWNPRREVFEGRKINWVTKDCLGLYAESSNKSKLLRVLAKDSNYDLSGAKNSRRGGWQKIKIDATIGGLEGWVESRYLSDTSPTRRFPLK